MYTVGNLYTRGDGERVYKLLKKEPCKTSGQRSQCVDCEKLQLIFDYSGPKCQINMNREPFFTKVETSNSRW